MKKIAVVGTGIMGSGIAANYLKAGYQVFIWNRSAAKTSKLQESGAVLSKSPKAAAEQADIVFEVTANDESSRSVWQGDDGILAGGAKDKALIASATLSADWTIRLSKLCSEQDFNFFDIPLTGGRAAAESGSLKLLAGGDEASLAVLKPDLEAISSKLFYFGPAGSGMKYKLILNGLQAIHMAGFGEAIRLAKQEGLDVSKVGPALCDRPGGEVTNFAWNAYQQAAMPLTFSVNWITKDLEYARQMGTQTQLPILDDALAAYQKARDTGHGDDDWAYITKPD